MSQCFFSPSDELTSFRKLTGEGYQILLDQLRQREVLVGKYEIDKTCLCPVLDSETGFEEFETNYRLRYYKSREFFAVPEDSKNFH